jgi:hypothetical protein
LHHINAPSHKAVLVSWFLTKQLTQVLNSKTLVRFEVSNREDSSQGLLGCDTVQWYGRIPTFQRTLLPPSPLYIITTQ